MKLLPLLSLLLCSCGTTVMDGHGNLLMHTFGDSQQIAVSRSVGGAVTFSATKLIHSKPTREAFSGATGLAGAVGAAVGGTVFLK